MFFYGNSGSPIIISILILFQMFRSFTNYHLFDPNKIDMSRCIDAMNVDAVQSKKDLEFQNIKNIGFGIAQPSPLTATDCNP